MDTSKFVQTKLVRSMAVALIAGGLSAALAPSRAVAAPGGTGGAGGAGGSESPDPQPNAGRITERAVLEMRATAFRTVQDLERIRFEGVRRIARLHREGASDDRIAGAASNIDERLTDRAQHGLDRIEAIKTHALTRLDAAGGSDEQKARVGNVATDTTGHVTTARDKAIERIANAVSHAAGT